MSGKSFFYGLLTGALIGGAAALLLSPKSGEENLNDLRKKIDDLLNDEAAPSNDGVAPSTKEEKDGE